MQELGHPNSIQINDYYMHCLPDMFAGMAKRECWMGDWCWVRLPYDLVEGHPTAQSLLCAPDLLLGYSLTSSLAILEGTSENKSLRKYPVKIGHLLNFNKAKSSQSSILQGHWARVTWAPQQESEWSWAECELSWAGPWLAASLLWPAHSGLGPTDVTWKPTTIDGIVETFASPPPPLSGS